MNTARAVQARSGHVKQLVKALLGRIGYGVVRTRGRYAQDGLFTLHSDHFRRDPAFQAAYRRGIEAGRGVDPGFEWRVHIALWAAMTAMGAPGDFVECGVNAGFMSSAIMHRLNFGAMGRRFYVIDTFDGPVLAQFSAEELDRGRRKLAEDSLAAGAYVTDLERVRENFSEWPNAVVVQGAAPDVLPSLEIGEVAFLHIDMNCAFPETAALEFFWRRLSRRAVVLLDDYAYFGHDEQRIAIDATARTLGAEVLSLPTGQGLIVR